jgi:hypothetical protein
MPAVAIEDYPFEDSNELLMQGMEDKENINHISIENNIFKLINRNIVEDPNIYIIKQRQGDDRVVPGKQDCALSFINQIFRQNYLNNIFVNSEGDKIININNNEVVNNLENKIINFNDYISYLKNYNNVFIDGMNILSRLGQRETYTIQECKDVIHNIKTNNPPVLYDLAKYNNKQNICNFIMILPNYIMKKNYNNILNALVNDINSVDEHIKDIEIILSKLENSHITTINLINTDNTNIIFIILKEPPVKIQKYNIPNLNNIDCPLGTEADELLLLYLTKMCNGLYVSEDRYNWYRKSSVNLNMLDNMQDLGKRKLNYLSRVGLLDIIKLNIETIPLHYTNFLKRIYLMSNVIPTNIFNENINNTYLNIGLDSCISRFKKILSNVIENQHIDYIHYEYSFVEEFANIKKYIRPIKEFINSINNLLRTRDNIHNLHQKCNDKLVGLQVRINSYKTRMNMRKYKNQLIYEFLNNIGEPYINYYENIDLTTISDEDLNASQISERDRVEDEERIERRERDRRERDRRERDRRERDRRDRRETNLPPAQRRRENNGYHTQSHGSSHSSSHGSRSGPRRGGSKKIKMTQKKNKKNKTTRNKKKKLTRKVRK